MSNENMQNHYEVGYKKPPKDSQFQKGISGNPRGRPRKSLDFNDQLIRESRSFMTIHENGQKIRISEQEVVIKQLVKLAMTGNTRGLQIYLEAQQRASERAASTSPPQSIESLRQQAPQDLTDEQLKMLILDNLKQQKQGVEWDTYPMRNSSKFGGGGEAAAFGAEIVTARACGLIRNYHVSVRSPTSA